MADAVTQHDPSLFTGLKTCESFRLLEFTRVELLRTVTPGSFVLAVSGEKPYANMEVMLSPLTYVSSRSTGASRSSGGCHTASDSR